MKLSNIITLVSKVRTWGLPGIWATVHREWVAVRLRRRIARLAAAPARGSVQKGITLIVDFTGRVSISKAMRDFVIMLKAAGVPCQVFDLCEKPDIPEEDYRDLLTPTKDFDFHRYTHIVEFCRSLLPASVTERRSRLVFYEGAAGLLEAMPYLDTDDSVIGMSDFNADYFRMALPRSRVYKIVYPMTRPKVDRLPRNEVRAKYGLGQGDFVAFFNFDFGSYYRKNPTATMRAFAQAFGAAKDVKLVFKVKNAERYPARVAEIRAMADELGIADRFVLLKAYLPRRDVDGLTDACDVYVSLHRSEGFGLGIAEAMSLGHPAIVTDWSSTTEFCKPDNSMPIPYRLVPIRPGEYMECMKEWADADVDAAAAALRKLYDDPVLRERLGQNAKAFIENHFSVENFRRSVEEFLAG